MSEGQVKVSGAGEPGTVAVTVSDRKAGAAPSYRSEVAPGTPRLRADHHLEPAGGERVEPVVGPARLAGRELDVRVFQGDGPDAIREAGSLLQRCSLRKIDLQPQGSFIHVGEEFRAQPRGQPGDDAGQPDQVRRDGDGLRFVPREHPRIGVALVSALRRGEIVAMQGDRAIGTRGHATIPFFGRPAWFPLGPFVLAAAARVPVVAAFCVLGPTRRYTVRLEPPIHVERGAEEAAARTWVASLERVVRDYPTQWFNFFDVWSPFAA